MDGGPRVDNEVSEWIDIFGCEDNSSKQMSSSGMEPGFADKAAVLQR